MSKITNKSNFTGNVSTSSAAGTASSNAVTLNADLCVITSESLTTAAGASQAITLTNNKIVAGTTVRASLVDYSGTFSTNGNPIAVVDAINTTNGTCNIVIINAPNSTNALSGTVKVLVEVITLI